MRFLQPSMSRGELDEGLRGRVDLAAYQSSLGKARNVITKPTGGCAKRPGTRFCGRTKYTTLTRILPFIYSTGVRYLIEAGDSYFRFWVDGALLTNSTKAITGITQANPGVVTSVAHGFNSGEFVLLDGIEGMDWLNGRTFQIVVTGVDQFQLVGANTSALAAYTGGGTASRVVELVTPYQPADLPQLRFTQSADVMYLAHGSHPTKELRRLSGTSFELVNYDFRRGPFRPFNIDEAAIMAVSGTQGAVTLTTNVDVFTPEMVGQLVYLEEKELRSIKPWSSAWKNAGVGTLARSDQKVYRVSAVPASNGSAGTPYNITGSTRPTHTVGRAWDGPEDIRSDGVNDYSVGVEWEFLHNVFGIVKITAVTNARTASGVVIERIPDSIVGTAPSPTNTWTVSGDGVDLQFPIAGAVSDSPLDYTVTIDGAPVQPNPFYPGGDGVSGTGGGNPRPGGPNESRAEQ